MVMATGDNLAGVVTKVTYFSVAAAVLIFVVLLLLTRIHP
jgi:hypothetical protein